MLGTDPKMTIQKYTEIGNSRYKFNNRRNQRNEMNFNLRLTSLTFRLLEKTSHESVGLRKV